MVTIAYDPRTEAFMIESEVEYISIIAPQIALGKLTDLSNMLEGLAKQEYLVWGRAILHKMILDLSSVPFSEDPRFRNLVQKVSARSDLVLCDSAGKSERWSDFFSVTEQRVRRQGTNIPCYTDLRSALNTPYVAVPYTKYVKRIDDNCSLIQEHGGEYGALYILTPVGNFDRAQTEDIGRSIQSITEKTDFPISMDLSRCSLLGSSAISVVVGANASLRGKAEHALPRISICGASENMKTALELLGLTEPGYAAISVGILRVFQTREELVAASPSGDLEVIFK